MEDPAKDLLLRLHRQAVAQIRGGPLPPPELPRIDLLENSADPALAEAWQQYRQEVPQLLDGKRGRDALVKAGHPLTGWDTIPDAVQASRLQYRHELCLVQEIQPSLRPLRRGTTAHAATERLSG